MSTDYRRKPQSRSYSRKAKNSGSSKSTFLGIIIGLIVAGTGWYYAPVISEKISTIKLHRPGEVHDYPANRKDKTHTQETTAVKPKPSAPEFDFYTVLPKNQVDAKAVANSVAKKPASAPVAASPPTVTSMEPANAANLAPAQVAPLTPAQASAPAAVTPTAPVKPTAPVEVAEPAQRFTLQTASLKNYADADSLKAQLTMLGFDVAIQKYTVNNQVRYRVFAGSYASKGAALKQQAMLKDNGISSILIKQSQ